ncbi:tail fiber protein [Halodesulfovibrio aestuarii]|uniref:Microcystin-dependent protein n=1 Tax=Halodesulfovibrio aestuarii TaxID=126333 RepID=A0A8G2FCD7_9BACT|nr:tail fiber protein [Halodesulfovibrio aestuarii]SHJ78177.1 Microcystin-dependent protein [Halodesulfovibrio aestuarii]
MATFINVRTTEVGQTLLAQVHAGSEELTITGIAFGSGAWTDEEYAERNLTALNNEVMRVAPSGGRQSGGAADITCVLTNVTLDEGFALTELGVIAEKKDGSEVLYMADCVPPVKSTWISANDEYRIEIPVTLRIKCSSNSTVEIRVESTVPVTNEDLENHNTAPNAHHDIRELLRTHTHTWSVITGKPSVFPPAGHTHTPNQVGLSNLPNAKSDSVTSTSSNSLATSKAVKIAYDKGKQALDLAGQKAASNHHHNSVYATKTHTHTPAHVGLGELPNAKSHSVSSSRNDVLATSLAAKTAYDRGTQALNAANTKAASNHNHDSRYYTESEVRSRIADSKIHGGIELFSGSVNSSGRPIDEKTGQPDLRYGVCDGRTYASPDGRNVSTPNMRDRFTVGAGGKYSVGSKGGAEKVSPTVSTTASHDHLIAYETGNDLSGSTYHNFNSRNTGDPDDGTAHTGGSQAHENRPPYIGVFYIKYL